MREPSAEHLARRVEKLTSILEVAKALASQRDLDRLLEMILSEAVKVVDADRCSLFIVDRARNELWTKVAQGTSEIRIPLGTGIAGAVAASGEVINIPDAYADPRFNRSVDQTTGYQTKTILCVPMRDASGAVVGVIQALNKSGGSFDSEDEELLLALGGQAAAALENYFLHEEISNLFEGFVNASVVAIESRDPTTAGHSGRVASLTVCLAQSLERAGGRYAGTRFTADELNEIRYASLLHDFGKVGVREPVLVKAEKLYPFELELLRARFELIKSRLETESYKRALERVVSSGSDAAAILAEEHDRRLAAFRELDEILEFVLACNRPTVLASGGFERLAEIGQKSFVDVSGNRRPFLTEHEVKALSIPRGSLSEVERKEIESHVTWTYKFLSQIPWTRSLKGVPDIAYAHHEKLDGRGYPRGLSEAEIPIQSRMMSISDIYDALTASDRPYKKAVPHELALDILRREAEGGQLDKELFTIFVEAKIPERALGPNR